MFKLERYRFFFVGGSFSGERVFSVIRRVAVRRVAVWSRCGVYLYYWEAFIVLVVGFIGRDFEVVK